MHSVLQVMFSLVYNGMQIVIYKLVGITTIYGCNWYCIICMPLVVTIMSHVHYLYHASWCMYHPKE